MRHVLYYLELTEPFGISRATFSRSESFIVRIGEGLGEAVPSLYFGEDEDAVEAALQRIERMPLPDLDNFEDVIDTVAKAVAGQTCATTAVDLALYDRLGKKLGVPVHKLFGRAMPSEMITSFTIGIAPMEEMLRKVDEARAYAILKIKLGKDLEHDFAIMREIRKAVGDKPLRVDANGGWTLEQALRAVRVMADLGVEYVEQPLRKGSLEELRALREQCPLPIYVDEDAVFASDLPRLAGVTHGINIKLMKCGGLSEARRMIALARTFDMKIMLGCRIESSLAITAAAHLGAFVDTLDLDGHLLVCNDPFCGVECDASGRMRLPDKPGLGVELRPTFEPAFQLLSAR